MSLLSALLDRRDAGLSTLNNPNHPIYQALVGWLDGGGQVASGQTVTRESSMRVSAVYAAVRLIAETIASLPIRVVRDRGAGGKETIEASEDRWAWERPNPDQTRQAFWELILGHAALTGNAYIYAPKNALGQTAELWALDPDRCRPEKSRATGLKVITVDGKDAGPDILHMPAFSVDGITGLSPIGVARQGVGLALAAEDFGARFFGQGSTPAGLLTTEQVLKPGDAERLAAEWQTRHAGGKNAHKIAVLGQGAKFQQVSIPPADAQFLETRKFQVAEIARLFRVPPHLIGDVERSTSWGTGIEQQNIGFLTFGLLPWLNRSEQTFSPLLARGRSLRHDVRGLLRGSTKERHEAYNLARVGGYKSVNEIRALEDDAPIEDGDVYDAPLNSNVAAPGQEGGGDRDKEQPGE